VAMPTDRESGRRDRGHRPGARIALRRRAHGRTGGAPARALGGAGPGGRRASVALTGRVRPVMLSRPWSFAPAS
jgi:hypothetical protein